MKTMFRNLGITAIVTVIAIGFAVSCDNGNGKTDPCDSGHTFTKWKVTTVATCIEDGVET